MKRVATILGTLAVGSAHVQYAPEEAFLGHDEISLTEQNAPKTVKAGRCQYTVGEQIFDISKFDSKVREGKYPAYI